MTAGMGRSSRPSVEARSAETFALGRAFTDARQQHGESELLDEIVSRKPQVSTGTSSTGRQELHAEGAAARRRRRRPAGAEGDPAGGLRLPGVHHHACHQGGRRPPRSTDRRSAPRSRRCWMRSAPRSAPPPRGPEGGRHGRVAIAVDRRANRRPGRLARRDPGQDALPDQAGRTPRSSRSGSGPRRRARARRSGRNGGIICTGESYKDGGEADVRRKGASLPDPARLSSTPAWTGNARRAIDIGEGEEIDAGAFRALVRAAVDLNTSG